MTSPGQMRKIYHRTEPQDQGTLLEVPDSGLYSEFLLRNFIFLTEDNVSEHF